MTSPKLKPRKRASHKGQNGRVLVVGGSVDYVGAPTFVCTAALSVLRAGADLATVAAPEKVAWAINCLSPDLITRKLPGKWLSPRHLAAILKLAEHADAVVVGNGIGLRPATKSLVRLLLKHLHKPVIIDADALRMIRLQEVRNSILLPHGGEFTALLRNSRLEGRTPKQIQPLLKDNILVLKGHPRTLIMGRTRAETNSTGNAGMTHGGTGDVLAGIIAGLIAQGNDAFTSCKVAAYVNGKAADRLCKRMGFGYLASDLVKEIPRVLRKFQRQA